MEFSDKIPKLIAGWLRGTLTPAEQQELDNWINESPANRLFFVESTDEKLLAKELQQFNQRDATSRLDDTLHTVDPETKPIQGGISATMKRFMIAACIILVAAAGIYFLVRHNADKDMADTTIPTTAPNNDVQPGTEKAVLTLADGTKIILDNTANGTIAQQGNTSVMKEDGLLAYNTDKNKPQAVVMYNTLNTTKGQEFRSLVLSDGTKVWLNSLSSIHFPTSFTGKERKVEITGEVYFEVTKNPHPFRVSVNGTDIEVFGTHFNVNAYDDELVIKTTLLEGSIKVSKNGNQKMVKPGQQAQTKKGSNDIQITVADLDQTIAWKEGFFLFKNNDIQTIMRQISRWYDVEVVYQGTTTEKFSGRVNRNTNLSEVLKAFEESNIHFKIQEKTITVMP